MNEGEWLACGDPEAMARLICGIASDRKLRLFACAFCRNTVIWENCLGHEQSRHAVEVTERFVEGEASSRELERVRTAAWGPVRSAAFRTRSGVEVGVIAAYPKVAWGAAKGGVNALDAAIKAGRLCNRPWQCHLFRDIFGPPPFRRVGLPGDVLASAGGVVGRLAKGIYRERKMPEGTLDESRLGILADAVEEAGGPGYLVAHLRSPGPHVLGCFAVDLCLGLS